VGNLEMKQAFDALRGYARSRGLRLSDVAADVVSRTLPPVDVLAPAAKRV
jgi:AmiR/NasT family two-component response regulator